MDEHFFNLDFWHNKLIDSSIQLKTSLLNLIPNIAAALILLVSGWVVANILKYIGNKFGQLIYRIILAIEKRHQSSAIINGNKFAGVFGSIIYWIVLTYFIFLSLKMLDLPGLNAWLNYVMAMLPHFISGLFIVALGVLFGALARNAIYTGISKQVGRNPYILAQTIRYAIITVFLMWGVEQTGINVSILANFIGIIIAAIFGGAALGFGIGSSHHVANMIGAINIKKIYQVGDNIQVKSISGTVIDITSTSLIVESESRINIVPAKLIYDEISAKQS